MVERGVENSNRKPSNGQKNCTDSNYPDWFLVLWYVYSSEEM